MSTTDNHELFDLVVPNFTRVLVCIVFAALLLLVPNGYYLLHPHIPALLASREFHSSFSSTWQMVTGHAGVNLGTMIVFWGLVAFGAYGVYWLIANVFINTYNEVTVDTRYVNSGSLRDKLSLPLLQLCLGLALAGLLAASSWIYSYLLVRFSLALTTWSWVHLAIEVGVGLLLALDLYAIWVLGKVTFAVN